MMCHLYHTLEAFNLVKRDMVIIRFYECSKGLTKQVPEGEVWLRRFNGKNYYIFIPPKKAKK